MICIERDGIERTEKNEETEMKDMVLLWSNFRFFDHESLLLATNHFSDESKIGRGGFGPVYNVFFLYESFF